VNFDDDGGKIDPARREETKGQPQMTTNTGSDKQQQKGGSSDQAESPWLRCDWCRAASLRSARIARSKERRLMIAKVAGMIVSRTQVAGRGTCGCDLGVVATTSPPPRSSVRRRQPRTTGDGRQIAPTAGRGPQLDDLDGDVPASRAARRPDESDHSHQVAHQGLGPWQADPMKLRSAIWGKGARSSPGNHHQSSFPAGRWFHPAAHQNLTFALRVSLLPGKTPLGFGDTCGCSPSAWLFPRYPVVGNLRLARVRSLSPDSA